VTNEPTFRLLSPAGCSVRPRYFARGWTNDSNRPCPEVSSANGTSSLFAEL
jgi:hypothetical protein